MSNDKMHLNGDQKKKVILQSEWNGSTIFYPIYLL